MRRFLTTRGVDLAIVVAALTALMPEPAWATGLPVPGPGAGGLVAGAAVVAALVIARWWRRD